jgi:hypothetical protein
MLLDELKKADPRGRSIQPQLIPTVLEVCFDIANGREPDDEKTHLVSTSMSGDVFQANAKRAQSRVGAAKELQAVATLKVELAELQRDQDAARDALQAARVEADRIVGIAHRAYNAAFEKQHALASEVAGRRSPAKHVLQSTAAESITARAAEVTGEINMLVQKIATLRPTDADRNRVAMDLANLPGHIVSLKASGTPADLTDAVNYAHKLTVATRDSKEIQRRDAQIAKDQAEIAALQAKIETIIAEKLIPENMELVTAETLNRF